MKKVLSLLVLLSASSFACVGQMDGGGLDPGQGTGGQVTVDPNGTGGQPGAGGRVGAGGRGGTSGAGGTPATAASGLPCDVQAMLAAKCSSCHGPVLVGGAPMHLLTYADLMAPSLSNPSQSFAQVSLTRMQNTALPMPPAPAARATAADIMTMQSWSATGYQMG